MGARRRTPAWRSAAAWRPDRRRADPPDGNSVRADRLSFAAAQLSAGVPAGAGRDGRRVRAGPAPDCACDHVRGDRYADALARGTWAVMFGGNRAADAQMTPSSRSAAIFSAS